MNPNGNYPDSPRRSTDTPKFFRFSILPQEELDEDKPQENQALAWAPPPGSDENQNQAQARGQGNVRVLERGEPVVRNIGEIVGSDHLRLSLRNPYYELFLRHKAPIIDHDGTVRCAQKGKMVGLLLTNLAPVGGSSRRVGVGIPVSAAEGQPPPVFAGMRAPTVVPASCYLPQYIDAPLPAPRNPNPNHLYPNYDPKFNRVPAVHMEGPSKQVPLRNYNYSYYDPNSAARGRALMAALGGGQQGAKRGWWEAPAMETEDVGPVAGKGKRPVDVGPIVPAGAERGEADVGGKDEDDVQVFDLNLKLGLP